MNETTKASIKAAVDDSYKTHVVGKQISTFIATSIHSLEGIVIFLLPDICLPRPKNALLECIVGETFFEVASQLEGAYFLVFDTPASRLLSRSHLCYVVIIMAMCCQMESTFIYKSLTIRQGVPPNGFGRLTYNIASREAHCGTAETACAIDKDISILQRAYLLRLERKVPVLCTSI